MTNAANILPFIFTPPFVNIPACCSSFRSNHQLASSASTGLSRRPGAVSHLLPFLAHSQTELAIGLNPIPADDDPVRVDLNTAVRIPAGRHQGTVRMERHTGQPFRARSAKACRRYRGRRAGRRLVIGAMLAETCSFRTKHRYGGKKRKAHQNRYGMFRGHRRLTIRARSVHRGVYRPRSGHVVAFPIKAKANHAARTGLPVRLKH